MRHEIGAVAAQPRVARTLPPGTRWWVDSWGWVWVSASVNLTPEEIEEITRQASEIRPGKPN